METATLTVPVKDARVEYKFFIAAIDSFYLPRAADACRIHTLGQASVYFC